MPNSLLDAGLRAVRRLAMPDSPCEATLARQGDLALLLVDMAQPAARDAIAYYGADHIWAPLDISRRVDGHDYVMARVIEPLEHFLHGRGRERVRAGELMTIAGSVLRGLGEMRRRVRIGDAAVGARWWVTDSGKPVLVVVEGESADVASARIMALLVDLADERETSKLLSATELVCRSRGADDFAAAEKALFHHAAPQPVTVSLLGTGTTPQPLESLGKTLSAVRARSDVNHVEVRPARVSARANPWREQPTSWRDKLIEVIKKVRTAWEDKRRPAPKHAPQVPSFDSVKEVSSNTADKTPNTSRKRAMLVAMALFVIIVGVGVFWPADDAANEDTAVKVVDLSSTVAPDPTAPPPQDANATQATEVPAESPKGLEPSSNESTLDLVTAATALLRAAHTCDADGTCKALMIDPSVHTQIPTEGLVELVDDYGGVAVVTVTRAESGATIIVIEKRNDRWIIREILNQGG